MTGIRVNIGKATIKDGKVQPKRSTYRAKQKRAQAARDEKRWLRGAKKP